MDQKTLKKDFRCLFLDETKDYDQALPRLERYAVRAIIFRGKKFLFVKSKKYHEYKFPGGGIEGKETVSDCLAREVLEETGYQIRLDSILPYGYYEEIRHGNKEEAIFDQTSFYFFTEIDVKKHPLMLTESEIKAGYKPVWVSIKKAIKENKNNPFRKEGTWIKRELMVMESLLQMKSIK